MQKINFLLQKKSRAIGYVESLIAIAIAGTLMVTIGLLTTHILRATIENELDDTATQQMVLYLDIIRAIKDNAWGTEDGQPPTLDTYDICYTEEKAYYLCDPNLESENLFDAGEDIFERKITVKINEQDGLIEFKFDLSCIKGKCRDLDYSESEVFKIEETSDITSINNPTCGNSVLDVGEECDDGNTDNGDGCSSVCLLPQCGDGVVDPDEDCDDGNEIDDDECTNLCTSKLCGNGIVDSGEECDDGNQVNLDSCTNDCINVVIITRSSYKKSDCGALSCPSTHKYPVSCSFRMTGPKTLYVWRTSFNSYKWRQGDGCDSPYTEGSSLRCSNVDFGRKVGASICSSNVTTKWYY